VCMYILSYVLSPFDQILKTKVLNSTKSKKKDGERKEWLHATTPDSERRRGVYTVVYGPPCATITKLIKNN
jgi:hypothetical protein